MKRGVGTVFEAITEKRANERHLKTDVRIHSAGKHQLTRSVDNFFGLMRQVFARVPILPYSMYKVP